MLFNDVKHLAMAKEFLSSNVTTPSGATLSCKTLRVPKANFHRKRFSMTVGQLDLDVTPEWLQDYLKITSRQCLLQTGQQFCYAKSPHHGPDSYDEY